jgi:DNA-binding NarL/FixJ family response regulator
MSSPLRVVIVDDQELVRAGFRLILDAEPDIEVVSEAGDGAAAVTEVGRARPDVVLMDVRMPGVDGIEATRRIRADDRLERARVLILTTFDLDEYVYEALRAGASGFLLKDTPRAQLVHAVRVVAAGDALLAPSVTRRLIDRFTQAPSQPNTRSVESLTARELEVLGWLSQGLSNGEIADALIIGEQTVKTHVARILSKLGLRDRVQAVVYAYENGLALPRAGEIDQR